jgi:hypothetical protein
MNCVQSHTDAEPVLEEPKLLTESELSTAPDTYTTVSHADPSSKYSANAYILVLNTILGTTRLSFLDCINPETHIEGGSHCPTF